MDRPAAGTAAGDDVPSEVLDELTPDTWGAHPTTLADLLPWIGEGMGVGARHADTDLARFEAKDVVLFLVDGLGERLLAQHRDTAPTLAALHAGSLRAGFPATTATSITSLMAGAPCGVHGILGYSFIPDDSCRTRGPRRILNSLRWTLDAADGPSALITYPPALVRQPAGVLEALAAADVAITYVMPGEFRGTGLTQAAFRASGRYIPALTPDGIRAAVAESLVRRSTRRRLVYAYLSDLDTAGHIYGPGSAQWLQALQVVDRLVADIVADLPADAALMVTGDHGMVAADTRVDLDAMPELAVGVEALAGEARVRHVYTGAGAAADVATTWACTLRGGAHVATRERVIDERWFGDLGPGIAERIGDVVAVARGGTVLVRAEAEPMESRMIGHHGSWTAAEQLVPLLVAHS